MTGWLDTAIPTSPTPGQIAAGIAQPAAQGGAQPQSGSWLDNAIPTVATPGQQAAAAWRAGNGNATTFKTEHGYNPMTGVRANIGAGIKSGIGHAVGQVLGDPVWGDALWPTLTDYIRGKPVANPDGTPIHKQTAPIGDWIAGIGGGNDVVATTKGEQTARAVGEGAGSMMPWSVLGLSAGGGGLSGLRSALRGIVSGAFGGGLGETMSQEVPEKWRPAVQTIVGAIGQLGAEGAQIATGKVFGAARNVMGSHGWVPKSNIETPDGPIRATPQQVSGAVGKVEQAAGDQLPQLQADLEKPGALVPGVNRTLAEQSPETVGVQGLDKAYRKDYDPQFMQRSREQAEAMQKAVQGIEPGEANPQTLARFFTDRLAEIEADKPSAAPVKAQQESLGGTVPPESNAPAIASAVNAQHAPMQAAADTATAHARTLRDETVGNIPQGPTNTPGAATGAEQAGAAARGQYLDARKAATDAESRLWSAIDPDGTAGVYSAPFKEELSGLLSEIPQSAIQPKGEEAAIHQTVRAWPDLVPLREVQALRTRISDAQSEENLPPTVQRRLGIAKKALDSALSKSIEATVAGGVGGDGSMAARLTQEMNTPSSANKSPTVQFEIPAGRQRRPENIVEWIISRGGVRPDADLRAVDADKFHHRQGGRLINPRGLPLDSAREAAVEEGFLRPNADINDLRNSIAETLAGNPVFRQSEQHIGANWGAARRAELRQTDDRFMAGSNVSDIADQFGVQLSDAEKAHAIELHMAGMDAEEAIRNAARSGEMSELTRNAQRNAVGRLGVDPNATQQQFGLGGSGGRVGAAERTLTREEADQVKAANAATAQRAQTFDNGATGKIGARGDYPTAAETEASRARGGFKLQDSEVLPSLWNAKTTESANLRQALEAGIDADTLKAHAADDLRRVAVDPQTGEFDRKAYSKWRRDHAAGLHIFPELAEAFGSADKAQAVLETARANSEAVAASHPIKDVPLHEIPGKYIVPGENGAAAARAFARDTGGDAEASRALDDSILYRMRREPGLIGEDGTIDRAALARFKGKYEGLLRERTDLAGKLNSLDAAQKAFDDASMSHQARLKEYQDGIAKSFLNDKMPVKDAVAKAFNSANPEKAVGELMRATSGNADASASLRRNVADWIADAASGGKPATETADFIKADQFRKFLDTHKPALLKILGGGQGLNTAEQIVAELRRQQFKSSPAFKPGPEQKPFAAGHNPVSTLYAVVAGHLAGGEVGAAALGGASHMQHSFLQAGIKTKNDLVAAMLLHPSLAKELLTKVQSGRAQAATLAQRRIAAAVQSSLLSSFSRGDTKQ